jgi:hypothetical protein
MRAKSLIAHSNHEEVRWLGPWDQAFTFQGALEHVHVSLG